MNSALLRPWLLCVGLLIGLAGCGPIEDLPFKPCAVPGAQGCECDATGGCDALADGTRLVCGADSLCQVPSCGGELQEGCLCGATACASGLVCMNGTCARDSGQTLSAPSNPKCYTPCRGGQATGPDGAITACSVDGLLEGCIGGALCRQGTCVLPVAAPAPGGGAPPPPEESPTAGSCTTDVECPDFQACIEHRCYSDCDRDSDCRGDRRCIRHVCRIPCTASGASCPAGYACDTSDGQSGHCMPVATSAPEPVHAETGTFMVSVPLLRLTPERPAASFLVHNQSPAARTFTVRKAKHSEYSDTGATLITQTPLHWLGLGSTAATEQVQSLTVTVPPNGRQEIVLSNANLDGAARWDGELEVVSEALGIRTVTLSYTGSLEGKWAGTMYFFANFSDRGLAAWRQDRDDRSALSAVGNAFIRRWGAFRQSRISLDEFKAMLTATQTESWKWASVKDRCPNVQSPNPNVGCYLYSNPSGLGIYSDYLPDTPIPTGASEFPVSLNLRRDTVGGATAWKGRIVSEESLQYAGSPAVSLAFSGDPSDCSSSVAGTCIVGLDQFLATVHVGGRYLTSATDTTCSAQAADTYALTRTPWLIPGFGPAFDSATNAATPVADRYRYECRDKQLPFSSPERVATNLSLAASNPIPDGTSRRRTLRLVDGAMINAETLFIIFEEHFPSFLDPSDPQGFASYGYMLLRKSPAHITAAEFQGSTSTDFRVPTQRLLNVGCTDELLAKVGVSTLDSTTAADVGGAVLDGVAPSASPPLVLDPNSTDPSAERAHYFCSATGLFDGGKADTGSAGAEKVACPAGSSVRYFTLTGANATQAAVAALSCQTGGGICRAGEPCIQAGCTEGSACASKGTCGAVLDQWIADPARPHGLRLDPLYRCTDPNEVLCNADRTDLRAGKTFYAETPGQVVFQSLDQLINEAFRYKVQFRTRSGGTLGFVPEICIPGSNQIPYCYDPGQIEQVRDRVDCATTVYTHYYDALGTTSGGQAVRSRLKSFLVRNYSYFAEVVPSLPAPVIHDGFERLNAELLVMLGDESYTSSFASRFDLAGQQLADFQGSLFEPGGINLSGGAGFELHSLYQAAQYYQMALDRFYRLSGVIWTSTGVLPPGQGFITPRTAVSYFSRLIRASSQKARANSEISKRYQAFNRPDLARLVVSRAYTSAYLESAILSRMMLRLIDTADAADRAQIVQQLELAQQTYRAALFEMANVHKDISDNVTYFGFQPDYVPFPALDGNDSNAFEKSLERAKDALARAAEKESIALADNRAFDTDAASFQSALAGLRDQYETQLSEICGTFVVTQDGQPVAYPAIPRYAYLDPRMAALGDPCGLTGTGALFEAAQALEQSRLDFKKVQLSQTNLLAQVKDVTDRTSEQCQRITTSKDFVIEQQGKILRLNDAISALNVVISAADRALAWTEALGGYVKCTVGVATDCPTAMVSAATYSVVAGITNGIALASESTIAGLQHNVAEAEFAIVRNEIEQECTAAQIDAKFEVKALYRQMLELQLDALKVEYDVKLALSQIQKLRNTSLQLMAGEEETQGHLINVAAAQNDPNVRIYRNDAIVVADQTFFRALQEAYKATKVFEYYTSQSYPALGNLVLVRMVAHGDFTLESYLSDLELAFQTFEESYGLPDTRAAIVSVKDHVLGIPRLGEQGTALTDEERTRRFREKLKDVTLLDARGYITMPFATTRESLSPLTRNHKILAIEAELVGGGVGDSLGRVYVRQRGTGSVLSLVSNTSYFAFPERTAVINTFFNGAKDLDPVIYRSERLRDRPYLNTGWELVFNGKDEQVNQDIDLAGLDDIKLYVYYTDFTQL